MGVEARLATVPDFEVGRQRTRFKSDEANQPTPQDMMSLSHFAIASEDAGRSKMMHLHFRDPLRWSCRRNLRLPCVWSATRSLQRHANLHYSKGASYLSSLTSTHMPFFGGTDKL